MKHKLYLFGALLSSIWILYFFGPFHKNKSKPKEGKYKTIYKGFSFDII